MIVGKPHNVKIKAQRKKIDKPMGIEPERVRNTNKDLFLTTIDTSNILV